MNLPVDEAQGDCWGAGAETSVITLTPRSGARPGGTAWTGASRSSGGQRGQGRHALLGGSVRRQRIQAGILEGKLLGLRALWSAPVPGQRAPCQLLGPPLAPSWIHCGDPRAWRPKPQPLETSVFLPEKVSVLFPEPLAPVLGAPSLEEALDPLARRPFPAVRPVPDPYSRLQSAVCGQVIGLPSRCCSPPRVLWVSHAFLTISCLSRLRCVLARGSGQWREFRWWPLLIRQAPQARTPETDVWAGTEPPSGPGWAGVQPLEGQREPRRGAWLVRPGGLCPL